MQFMKNLGLEGTEPTLGDFGSFAKHNTDDVMFDYQNQIFNIKKKRLLANTHDLFIDVTLGALLIDFIEIDLMPCYKNTLATVDFDEYTSESKEYIDDHDEIESMSAYCVKEFTEAHPYLDIFPPVFIRDFKKGFEEYFRYVGFVQIEFKNLLKWCFDVDFYPDVLSELTASERFYLYGVSENRIYTHKMKQIFQFEKELRNNYVPKKKSQTHFEFSMDLPAGIVDYVKQEGQDIMLSYLCESLNDIASLEFLQMIDLNYRIKKCKNCGGYFVLSGKHNSDYCSKILGDTNQTCQNIGALKNYKNKVDDNEAHKLFLKYYKRYHARQKVGSIKPDKFKKWNMDACTKRDLCADNQITAKEFEQWLEDSFVNRKKGNQDEK